MSRSARDWTEELESRPVVTILKWALWPIVLISLVVVAFWMFGVLTAPWQGKGDARQEKNSSQNWTSAQREFHREANDVDAFKAKIATAKQDITNYERAHTVIGNDTPYDPVAQQDNNLRTVLSGLQQQCVNVVSSYNTDARSYLTEDWRDADLPDHLDPNVCI
jgi:hypothetical protein